MARAGVLPGDTQASHAAFISAKFAMSVIQVLAESSLLLSVPASARKPSICDSMLLVCSAVLLPLGAVRDDTGEIDSVAVDHGLAHAQPVVTALGLLSWRFLSRWLNFC